MALLRRLPSILGPTKARGASTETRLPPRKYGGRQTVTLIPADGVGPKITNGIKQLFKLASVPVDFEEIPFCVSSKGSNVQTFEDVLTSIRRNGTALKGNWITLYNGEANSSSISFNVLLRQRLGLFANVVTCRSHKNVPTRHQDVDMVIIRQNTEGEYSHLEHENVPGVVEMLKVVTEEKSREIAQFAFDYALRHRRKKVTCVHKANIMKLGDGLFLNVCSSVAKLYPSIQFDNMIVDNCAMQMVKRPQQFDVVLLPNLYGNVVSNIGAALVGGPGVPPGENYSTEYSVFEAGTRNVGRDLVAGDLANPMSLILAACKLLHHLGYAQHSSLFEQSVENVVASGKARTKDIGGSSTTTQFFEALFDEVEAVQNKAEQ